MASSGPVPRSMVVAAAWASGDVGSLVMARVGAPWRRPSATTADDVRRRARLADPDDERPIEPRLRAVERDHRRRPEPDRQVVPDPQHVLGVDRRVIARATGGDDDVIDAALAEGRDERLDDVGGACEESGGYVRLLEDLVAEGHRAVAERVPSREPGRMLYVASAVTPEGYPATSHGRRSAAAASRSANWPVRPARPSANRTPVHIDPRGNPVHNPPHDRGQPLPQRWKTTSRAWTIAI